MNSRDYRLLKFYLTKPSHNVIEAMYGAKDHAFSRYKDLRHFHQYLTDDDKKQVEAEMKELLKEIGSMNQHKLETLIPDKMRRDDLPGMSIEDGYYGTST